MAIITLTLQGRLRLPLDLEASLGALAQCMETARFDSLFTSSDVAVQAG
jgi:hypothetical protein